MFSVVGEIKNACNMAAALRIIIRVNRRELTVNDAPKYMPSLTSTLADWPEADGAKLSDAKVLELTRQFARPHT